MYCSSCEDVFTIKENIIRTCQCGKVSGTIRNDQAYSNCTTNLSYTVSATRWQQIMLREIDMNVAILNVKHNEEDKLFCIKVIEYLNDKAGTGYKTKFPSTSATLILERKKEYDLIIDDFYKVIDKKCKDWLWDEHMKKFLRPMTLFNKTKFENYIGELNGKQSDSAGGKVLSQFASSVHEAKK